MFMQAGHALEFCITRAAIGFGALAQQREVAVVDECPAAPAAGRLAHDARVLKMGERARDGRPGKAERLRCLRNADERLGLENLVETQPDARSLS